LFLVVSFLFFFFFPLFLPLSFFLLLSLPPSLGLSDLVSKVDKSIFQAIRTPSVDLLSSDDDDVRKLAAKTVGLVCKYVSDEDLLTILTKDIYPLSNASDWHERDGKMMALAFILDSKGMEFSANDLENSAKLALKHLEDDDNLTVRESSLWIIGRVLGLTANMQLLSVLLQSASDSSSNIRQGALGELKTVAEQQPELLVSSGSSEDIMGAIVTCAAEDDNIEVRRRALSVLFFVFGFNKSNTAGQQAAYAFAKKMEKGSPELAEQLVALAKSKLPKLNMDDEKESKEQD
jgi:HEAT repeat protein